MTSDISPSDASADSLKNVPCSWFLVFGSLFPVVGSWFWVLVLCYQEQGGRAEGLPCNVGAFVAKIEPNEGGAVGVDGGRDPQRLSNRKAAARGGGSGYPAAQAR